MSQIHNLQIDLLFLLYASAQVGSRPRAATEILSSEKTQASGDVGPISISRVETSLSALVRRNHVNEHIVDGEGAVSTYSITAKGINWVEDWFSVSQEGTRCFFVRRRKGTIFVDLSFDEASERPENKPRPATGFDPHSWTKWGTILTGLGIVVAVVLWKFS